MDPADRDRLIDELVALGFEIDARTLDDDSTLLCGEFETAEGTEPLPLLVTVPAEFPYARPRVRPEDGSGGNSWHQERDGTLCLWHNDAHPIAWSTADAVLSRTRDWFTNATAGWPQDAPALDLDRYWPHRAGLVLYGDLDELERGFSRLGQHGLPVGAYRTIERFRKKTAPNGFGAFIVDIGEPTTPPRELYQITDAASRDDADLLLQHLDRKKISWVLVKYQRHGQRSLLALHVSYPDSGPEFSAVATASDSIETLLLRAGGDHAVLRDARITIVGVGAVGSAVAEQFVRCGARHLTLVDGDVLRPGNLIRHQADPVDVGRPKVEATGRRLKAISPHPSLQVESIEVSVIGVSAASRLLDTSDLVIEATGNDSVSQAFIDASHASGGRVLVVALTQQGRVARVDVSPLPPGIDWDAEPELPPVPPSEIFEGGCGDPITPAAPWKPLRLASAAVKIGIELLAGRTTDASHVETL